MVLKSNKMYVFKRGRWIQVSGSSGPCFWATIWLCLCSLFSDGRKEEVHLDKITSRIQKLCYGLNMDFVDPVSISLSRVASFVWGVIVFGGFVLLMLLLVERISNCFNMLFSIGRNHLESNQWTLLGCDDSGTGQSGCGNGCHHDNGTCGLRHPGCTFSRFQFAQGNQEALFR